MEYHHLLVKARKFLGAVTAIENYEIENASRTKTNRTVGDNEMGIMMTSLLQSPIQVDERGGERGGGSYQADEMTFSNIAGVISNVDKVCIHLTSNSQFLILICNPE